MEKEKKKKVMLGLKLPTDPRWVNIVEKNISEILTDHAYCEQKAASNAITNIIRHPDIPELVEAMIRIAKEEMEHFGQVHEIIQRKGFELGRERKDEYVHEISAFIKRGGDSRERQVVDNMLFGAMIEARSCERFRVLSQEISDPELREFYHELMVSEADHYTTFISLARKYGTGIDVDARWQEILEFEGQLMIKYGKKETIHG